MVKSDSLQHLTSNVYPEADLTSLRPPFFFNIIETELPDNSLI